MTQLRKNYNFILVSIKLLLLCLFFIKFGFIATSSKFNSLITHASWLALCAYILIWAASIGSIIIIAFNPRFWVRSFWTSIIFFGTFIGYLYYYVYQQPIDINTIEILLESRHLATQVGLEYANYLLQALIPSIIIMAALLLPGSYKLFKRTIFQLAPITPILLIVIATINLSGEVSGEGLPQQFWALSNIGAIALIAFDNSETFLRNKVNIPPQQNAKSNNIVFIVDESTRGDFLSINDKRKTTTPFLVSQMSRIANFGLASSGANCSARSNAILRFGLNPKTIRSGKKAIMQSSTIWQYAKKAGFETIYLDDQSNNGKLQDFMNASEKKYIDKVIQTTGKPKYDHDFSAIKVLHKILLTPGKHFIYMDKYGSHHSYEHDYPKNVVIYAPHMKKGDPIKNRQHLLNSYKNSIHWQVDTFFKKLLMTVELKNTVIIYTSDHGQNLLDDGIPVTHCRTKATWEEALVPLFVISGDQKLFDIFKSATKVNYNRSNHFQIFPTLLYLMGYNINDGKFHTSLLTKNSDNPGFVCSSLIRLSGAKAKWCTFPDSKDRMPSNNINGIFDAINK